MSNDGTAARRALLVVVSSPSGGGKTTLAQRLLRDRPDMSRSVSCTTRAPRGGEVAGRDYHFLSPAEFAQRVAAGEFLEHAEVHGNRYGTLRRTVEETLQAGRTVLLVIDVQGGASVRQAAGDYLRGRLVDIFVVPPSLETLQARLAGRGEDAPEVIERRLANAAGELARAGEYRYQVVNDDLETAYARFRAIIEEEERKP